MDELNVSVDVSVSSIYGFFVSEKMQILCNAEKSEVIFSKAVVLSAVYRICFVLVDIIYRIYADRTKYQKGHQYLY